MELEAKDDFKLSSRHKNRFDAIPSQRHTSASVGGGDFFGSSNLGAMNLDERIRLLAGNQQFSGLNDRARRGSFIQEKRAALKI